MCGIAGFAGAPALEPDAGPALEAMLRALVHRGPDEEGMHLAAGIALGSRRLSIIDLAGGHQPIWNEDRSVAVVFNGEIYNYRPLRAELTRAGHLFRTRSDTEVLVHLYEEHGERLVDRLRGMFAFALWDARRGELLLARDRFGIKPLCYALTADGIVFASECGALAARPRAGLSIDPVSIGRYLAFGYVPDPWTIFAEARKLAPGHLLRWSPSSGATISRYWRPEAGSLESLSEADAVAELRRLLDEVVALHLEAEVPLGAFLSGGVDSSTVVALMVRHSPERVRTFSIGFSEPGYNEAPDAARVAAALGTEHTELLVRPDVARLFEEIIGLYDEPFGDASAIPTYLVSRLAREHVKVVLSGDGGDELFGGYDRYVQLSGARELPMPVRRATRWMAGLLPLGTPGRNRLYNYGRTLRGQYTSTLVSPLGAFEGGVGRSALGQRLGSLEDLLAPWFETVGTSSFLASTMLVDQLTYLPGDILTKVDRASMAVSLEARVPLLDHRLAEFANALHTRFKVARGGGKLLFKRAVRGLVPDQVLDKPKQGFCLPVGRWFRGALREQLEAIRGPQAQVAPYVEQKALERVLAEHLRGWHDHSQVLWQLLALELWLRRMRASGARAA